MSVVTFKDEGNGEYERVFVCKLQERWIGDPGTSRPTERGRGGVGIWGCLFTVEDLVLHRKNDGV